MAVRNIATSDTLETFRTEFNAEAINFGDIATLNAGLTATTIVGSVNEIYTRAIVGKNQGTNFTNTLLVGHTTTGTLNAAEGNTGVGIAALQSLTSGDSTTAMGANALKIDAAGRRNVMIGVNAGDAITSGHENTSVGTFSLSSNQTSTGNTALGYQALGVATGHKNIGIGYTSGGNITSGAGNVVIGVAEVPTAPGSDQLSISDGYDGAVVWLTGDSSGDITFPNDITVTGSINGTFSGTVGANTVTNTSIANNAVTQAKIADDAVGHDELQNVQS